MYKTRRFGNYGSKQLKPDLTPLIDVVFLLLIFFMVATTFEDTGGMKIELPKTDLVLQDVDLTKKLTVLVDKSNNIKLQIEGKKDSRVIDTDKTKLTKEIASEFTDMKDKAIGIKADRVLEYGEIVDIMALVKEAGAHSIDIETKRK